MKIKIIGKSEQIEDIIKQAKKVAKTSSTILIRGESGVGKELIARLIHYSSPRKDKPFIAVACAALESGILTSELFGHERGAFTNAYKEKKGRFELANSGTIFLDEIGDISQDVQIKLLRVLQERKFERVGGMKTIPTDVRVIAATNKDLEKATKEGKFREDLYYRLNVIPIFIPPLRERKEDIPLLVSHFLKKYAKKLKEDKPRLTSRALEFLKEYDWPGNIRELENCMERVVAMSSGSSIGVEDLFANLKEQREGENIEPLKEIENQLLIKALMMNKWRVNDVAKMLDMHRATLCSKLVRMDVKKEICEILDETEGSLKEVLRRHVIRALNITGWNKRKAANLLQIHRNTLTNKMKRWDIGNLKAI